MAPQSRRLTGEITWTPILRWFEYKDFKIAKATDHRTIKFITRQRREETLDGENFVWSAVGVQPDSDDVWSLYGFEDHMSELRELLATTGPQRSFEGELRLHTAPMGLERFWFTSSDTDVQLHHETARLVWPDGTEIEGES